MFCSNSCHKITLTLPSHPPPSHPERGGGVVLVSRGKTFKSFLCQVSNFQRLFSNVVSLPTPLIKLQFSLNPHPSPPPTPDGGFIKYSGENVFNSFFHVTNFQSFVSDFLSFDNPVFSYQVGKLFIFGKILSPIITFLLCFIYILGSFVFLLFAVNFSSIY